jgi:hypothetical protein
MAWIVLLPSNGDAETSIARSFDEKLFGETNDKASGEDMLQLRWLLCSHDGAYHPRGSGKDSKRRETEKHDHKIENCGNYACVGSRIIQGATR